MIRRVSFWCAVSAALTVAMFAMIGYAVVTKDRIVVSTPFMIIASYFLGRQTGELFFIRKSATADYARSVSRHIGTGTVLALMFLITAVCLMAFVFGADATGLIVGHVVLIVAIVATSVFSREVIDQTYPTSTEAAE